VTTFCTVEDWLELLFSFRLINVERTKCPVLGKHSFKPLQRTKVRVKIFALEFRHDVSCRFEADIVEFDFIANL